MKDAKGHGSEAHSSGVQQIGRTPLIAPGVWFHGSPLGEPGVGQVHVGKALAAKQALEARIGIPADGKGWSGDREYGKTLLAGQDTLKKLDPRGYNVTGVNCDAPKNDYYPSATTARMGNGNTAVPLSAKPAVAAYSIAGRMSNSPANAYDDAKANGYAKRIKNSGVFYKNIGEDSGSVSAVVPSKDFLRRVA
jgi:hypothetical protein